MKILHVVESLERGGLERVVISLAMAQRSAGHDVQVNCLFREGLLADELRKGGMAVRCAGKRSGFDLAALGRLRSHARDLGATIVHTHNAVANYYAAAALLGTGVTLVNTRHGMGAGVGARKEQLYRISLHRTAAVAAVCEAARRAYAADGLAPAAKLHVVRNGIALDGFTPGVDQATARRLLGIDADAIVVGTVGRLNQAKNHLRLIEAFAVLHATCPASRLIIIGGGGLQLALQQQITARGIDAAVLLVGDRGDVPALLPAFDLFALTSDTEGYSVALLEAGATGLPCVVSDVGGNAEIVQDGITGVVVREPTPAAFATAFGCVINDANLRRTMGNEARRWVERHGSVGAMVRVYDDFYGAAVSRKRSEAA